jgi:hypothetical protein
MVVPLTPAAFYDSARDFAKTALEAHRVRKHRRVALDAGTALEHLAKACLAARSPALLTELKTEKNFPSLLRLLDIPGGKPQQLRTVGLRDALDRVKTFVTSTVLDADLRTLIDMRDGTVHAAQDDEVEARLVVAFVQHADALLADLGHDRAAFWRMQLDVVDALLADASDKVAHRVKVKLAQSDAYFERQYGELAPGMLDLIRRLAIPRHLNDNQARTECPVCDSYGVATGTRDVVRNHELGEDANPIGSVWFTACEFACGVCGLQLDSAPEFTVARKQSRWEIEDADPREYLDPHSYEDEAYEAWREKRLQEE